MLLGHDLIEMNIDPSKTTDCPNTDTSVRWAPGDIINNGITTAVSSGRSFLQFRLPPELLGAIFLEYAQACRYPASIATQVPPWVAVSYVCRYWRGVALGYANLWTRLFFVSRQWMAELLRRSKSAPLIIYVDFSRIAEGDFGRSCSLQDALAHMERIKEICIHGGRWNICNAIWNKLTLMEAAPLLQSLYLSPNEDHFIDMTEAGAMPSLQRMYLESCKVDWSSPIFTRLTDLTLNHTLSKSIQLDDFLLLLSRAPCLRRLCLQNTFSPDEIEFEDSLINTQNTTKVSLPQLNGLILTEPIPWVAALLAQVEFPQSTVVQLMGNCESPEDVSLLLPFIMDRFDTRQFLLQSPTSKPVLRSLGVFLDKDDWTVVCSTSVIPQWLSILSLGPNDLNPQFPLRIQFTRMEEMEEVSLDEIIPLLRVLPLTHVNAIALRHFDENDPADQDVLTEAFRDAPELQLILVIGCARMLIHALQPRAGGGVFAPALSHIRFIYIDFRKGRCADQGSHGRKRCIQCLRDVLTRRMEAGFKLQKLIFARCIGISTEDVAELSQVVGQVEWVRNIA